MDKPKLYKCYKPGCGYALENPFLTEQMYDELPKANGKVSCPCKPPSQECGLQECKPEDLPNNPEESRKKMMLIGGIACAVLVISLCLFFILKPKNKGQIVSSNTSKETTAVKNSPTATDSNKSTGTSATGISSGSADSKPPAAPQPKEEKPAEKTKPPVATSTSVPVGNYATFKEDPGAKHSGKIKEGTMIFHSAHLIADNDPQKRMAEPGDKVVGKWINGQLSNANWYDKDGNLKGKFYLGTTGD